MKVTPFGAVVVVCWSLFVSPNLESRTMDGINAHPHQHPRLQFRSLFHFLWVETLLYNGVDRSMVWFRGEYAHISRIEAHDKATIRIQQIRHNIKNNTVDKLKHILSGLNEECFAHLSKTGKKQDIIDRIVHALDDWRRQNNADKWSKAKAVVTQVRLNGV